MAFEHLLHIERYELELFDQIVEILQSNFGAYRNVVFCLPLGPAAGERSAINEIRLHNSTADLDEYLFGGKFQKTCVLIKFKDGYYDLRFFGHFILKTAEVHFHSLEHIFYQKESIDRATEEIWWDHQFVKSAFGAIQTELVEAIHFKKIV